MSATTTSTIRRYVSVHDVGKYISHSRFLNFILPAAVLSSKLLHPQRLIVRNHFFQWKKGLEPLFSGSLSIKQIPSDIYQKIH